MPRLNFKLLLFTLLFLIATFAFAFLLYFFFFKKPKPISAPLPLPSSWEKRLPEAGPTVPGEKPPLPSERLPTIAPLPPPPPLTVPPPSLPTPLTDWPLQDITLNQDGQSIRYYNQKDGKFWQLSPSQSPSLLTDETFYQVEKITWSPDKNKAVLEYPDGANIVYDFEKKQSVTLPQHWQEFSFSPEGEKLAFKSLGLDPENRFLAISKSDGSEIQMIEPLGKNENLLEVNWSPNQQIIATYTQGRDFDRQELFFVGKEGENFKSTMIEGRGFQGLWNPNGDKLIYSIYSSQSDLKPTLWVVEAKGENIGLNRKNLRVNTWVQKCTFAQNEIIYCAAPQTLEEGSGLFPETANNTSDFIYKIDLNTGVAKRISDLLAGHSIEQLLIDKSGRSLFFTDKQTGRLYELGLF